MFVLIALILVFILISRNKSPVIPTVTRVNVPFGTISQSSSAFSWNGSDPDGTITKYEYRKDGGSWTSNGTGKNYTWSGYSEGSHKFEVRAQDNEGVYSNIISWSFVYDVGNKFPTVTIVSGPSGTISQSSSAFSWTGSDPDGTITKYEYRKDGGSWVSNGTSKSYTWSGYSEGSHKFEVRAQDNEGDYSNIISWSFTYDEGNKDPTVTKVSGPSGTISQSSSTFTWNGSDPDGTITKYEYRKDGGSWVSNGTSKNYTWSGYSEGSHKFEVRAQDNEGVYSTIISWSFTYDEGNKDPTVTKVNGPGTISQTVTISQSSSAFSWTGSDPDGTITKYEYRKDGGSWTSNGTSKNYTWSGYSEGSHKFEVRAQDNEGDYSNIISWSFITLPET